MRDKQNCEDMSRITPQGPIGIISEMAAELEKLRAANVELREALTLCVHWFDGDGLYAHEVTMKARAALAKHGG